VYCTSRWNGSHHTVILAQNRDFCLPHLHSTPPLGGGGVPIKNIAMPFGVAIRSWKQFDDTIIRFNIIHERDRRTGSVLFSVPQGLKIVLGNYNYPSHRDGHSVRTDAIFRHWQTVNIVLRYFPSLCYLTFIRGCKQYAHYKTPQKRCELKNNFGVGPRDSGRPLKWLTLIIICCYN